MYKYIVLREVGCLFSYLTLRFYLPKPLIDIGYRYVPRVRVEYIYKYCLYSSQHRAAMYAPSKYYRWLLIDYAVRSAIYPRDMDLLQ